MIENFKFHNKGNYSILFFFRNHIHRLNQSDIWNKWIYLSLDWNKSGRLLFRTAIWVFICGN